MNRLMSVEEGAPAHTPVEEGALAPVSRPLSTPTPAPTHVVSRRSQSDLLDHRRKVRP